MLVSGLSTPHPGRVGCLVEQAAQLAGIATYGCSTAMLLVQILKQSGDNLTRASIMKQATKIKDYVADLALPGMTTSTEPDDYRINRQFQMMQFDGERWVLFRPILTDAFTTN